MAAALITALAWAGIVPFLAVAALLVLLLRAEIGFSERDTHITARTIGIRELGFGAMTVLAMLVGHAVGW